MPFAIAVAPQIAPFTFGDEAANAGEMATVQCAVIKGDLPIDVVWSFNGRVIDANGAFDEHNYDNSDIVISSSSKRASQLTIESVAARHAGEYSCTASNTAGTATHSSVLSVNGMLVQFESMTVGWLVGRTKHRAMLFIVLHGTQETKSDCARTVNVPQL